VNHQIIDVVHDIEKKDKREFKEGIFKNENYRESEENVKEKWQNIDK
jgi:hypothetical protein